MTWTSSCTARSGPHDSRCRSCAEQGGGRIINVTNLGAKAPGAASVPTSVSRAAGVALTKAMSKEFAEDNILVNTVCIGLIKSGQHETRFKAMQESLTPI